MTWIFRRESNDEMAVEFAIGVFPKHLYIYTGEGLSPRQNVKYIMKCIEMRRGQDLIEIFFSN